MSDLEPDVFEDELTLNGLPDRVKGVFGVNPALVVSNRTYGTQVCGYGFCGGVNSVSEEFTLIARFQ